MNLKTTFFLLVVLAGCAVSYLIFKPDPAKIREARLQKPEAKSAEDAVEQTLLKDVKLGDIVKVTCKLAAQAEPWVFEKTKVDDKDVWDITSPLKARAASWQVDSIHRRMSELRYDISYKVGEGGVTPAEAGLDAPTAVVAITDKDGKSAAVEIGKSNGRNETYARIAGGDRIIVATTSFATFFKDSILEYRDSKLFDFKAEEAVRLEVTSRVGELEKAPVTYVLVKDGEDWVFESPFSCKATEEVKTAITTLAGVRVSKWKDNDPAKLPVYALDKPAVSLAVTVRKEKPAEKKGAEGDAAGDAAEAAENPGEAVGERAEDAAGDKPAEPPVVETAVYALHLSSVSPLGEDTNLYVRVGDEAAVGTVPKTTTDKLTPVESKWRDMRVSTASAGKANRVQVTVGGRTADLLGKNGKWSFADSSAPADEDAVKDVLKAVASLNAKAFVALKAGEEGSMGLAAPEAVVTLTIPGQDQPERITIGGPSDGDLKRMFYVRRNDSSSVAKVRAEDLKSLLRPITDFRSREVFSLAGGQIQQLELSYANPVADGRMDTAFERTSEGVWKMTRPVAAGVAKERLEKLADSFKSLKGKRYVGEGEDLARYGLASPAATVKLTYVPSAGSAAASPAAGSSAAESSAGPAAQSEDVAVDPKAPKTKDKADKKDKPKEEKDKKPGKGGPYQEPPADAGKPAETSAEAGEGAESASAMVAPATPQTVQFLAGEAAEKFYLKRSDAAAVYEIEKDFYDKLRDEYRAEKVLDFTDSQATAFSIRSGATTRAFEKREGKWVLAAEPDLPLDAKAVGALLVNVADLKTTRYVQYGVSDLSAFGLTQPATQVSVTLDDGTKLELLIADKTCERDASKRVYASRGGQGEVFLLGSDMVQRLEVKIETLEAKE
ncbi:MAG: DUF4340 domain-containing protein [Phycisphaerales bacterium]|nr:DUF4340 domain-containing protein [Phycisphaerales bacterium]